MTETLFWSLIDNTKQHSIGDCATQAELLREALRGFTSQEVCGFQFLFVGYSRLARRYDFRAAAL